MKKIETLFGLVGLTVALAGCPGDDSGDTSTTDAATTIAATTEATTEQATTDEATTEQATTDEPATEEGGDTTTTGAPACDPACAAGEECIDGVCFPTGGDTTTTGTTPDGSDYGPCDSCAPGEMPVMITGLEGCFCSPMCDGQGSMCPAPNEGTGQAQCALETMAGAGPSQCALLCMVGGTDCPPGATCQDTGMMGVGLCTHP
ncbi:MAG: hypothetical protein AAF799_38705 [Myxococcota bacterium]